MVLDVYPQWCVVVLCHFSFFVAGLSFVLHLLTQLVLSVAAYQQCYTLVVHNELVCCRLYAKATQSVAV